MARLAAAFGTSHSPALNSPPADFVAHAQRDVDYPNHLDKAGHPTTFGDLVRNASPAIAAEITPDRIAARVAACTRHIHRLAAAIAAARLDALVIVGDDQHEQYRDDNLPAFLVYWGDRIVNTVSDLPDSAPEYWKRARAQY
ncbi:MAG: extradiol ring-cleavage dioxygenase, partial [Betaproteobacteria bacterium]|nr:extradiol ring-cleavage dioxygenase [Betaproteobacteria bacterium]